MENDQYTKYPITYIQNIYNIHEKFIPTGREEITCVASILKSYASTGGIVTTDHLLHFLLVEFQPPLPVFSSKLTK